MQKEERFPEKSVVIGQDIAVLVRLGSQQQETDVSALRGMLKEHRDEYTSVALQEKAKEWWSDVSD